MRTTAESTLGRGMNMVRGTLRVTRAAPFKAIAAVTAPYSAVPGCAQKRSATSSCTMTVSPSQPCASSKKRMTTGVVT